MYQCGPEWHILQFQSMRVVSDLITLNACVQFVGTAIAKVQEVNCGCGCGCSCSCGCGIDDGFPYFVGAANVGELV
jgi:hypothetical protein